MTKKIFIWIAHPKAGSLCESIGRSYQTGALREGAEVRVMKLNEMTFDMDSFEGYNDHMPPLEPDLKAWQDNIAWADHILIVHPYWWATMPYKAKAVLDRALLSGFAYKYHAKGVSWDKLLTGKTADAIITSDTPPLIDTLLYGRPGRRVMKNQILGFCGIKAKKVIQFGSVKTAPEKKITKWLNHSVRMGETAAK